MALSGSRTYVGFGFGAIQAGLLLYEAYTSGAFARLVVAEVLPDRVKALRNAGGFCTVNIAHADRVEAVEIGPIEIFDPAVDADRAQLVAAIAEASEIGTAIPSVNYYVSDGPGSLHRVLASGLAHKLAEGGPQAVIYAAENDNHAAEKLEAAVSPALNRGSGYQPDDLGVQGCHTDRDVLRFDANQLKQRVNFLNTVIGKMSGFAPRDGGLASVTPGDEQAFLVEAFNTILITRVELPALPGRLPFRRGIAVFEEKADLLPFEEAKLYGHNAVHALAAYLGHHLGITHIGAVRTIPGMMEFLRVAFLEESGAALISKYAGVDPLFTPTGFAAYADDLLARMTNPFLQDTVARVGRDPVRKLGWDDRLIGTMRLALSQGITPTHFALGAAAAVDALTAERRARFPAAQPVAETLAQLWADAYPESVEAQSVTQLIIAAQATLQTDQSTLFL